MEKYADIFHKLTCKQKRVVHFVMCEHALRNWYKWADSKFLPISYSDSVVGLRHIVDKQLPNDAYESAKQGKDIADVRKRYLEPIVAMQDYDLEFPEHITYAYYALYNLFGKYVLGKEIEDWIIVNQAGSSEQDSKKRELLLSDVIEKAANNHKADEY